MFKKKLPFLFFLLFPLFLQSKVLSDTSRYENGVRKEVGYEEGKLVKTVRKLYDRRGNLIEQHFFNGSNSGVIKSYYSDTSVASVISVIQSINSDGKYTLTVPAGSEMYGYFKGTNIKKYSLIVKNTFDIFYDNSYDRYNVIFNDFVLLYKRRILPGIEGSKITYFRRDQTEESNSVIGSQDEGSIYRTFYDNKQVKAEGHIKKVRSSDYFVGYWTFYSKDGLILKEEKYYNGEKSEKHIKYGTRIDTAYYRYPLKNGQTQAVVLFAQLDDFSHREDTLETYYENGKIRSRYDESQKTLIRKKGINRDDIFEFSGLYEEFYDDGERKVRGYLCKPPRRQVSLDEFRQPENKCINTPTSNPIYFQNDKMIKQIGMWYYFDKQGDLIDIKEYRLCGDFRKEQLSKKKIEKESSKYKLQKEKYEFVKVINDNE